jgi:signal peptidase I
MNFSAKDKRAIFLAWETCGKRQTVKIAGNSMNPFLYDGCSVVVEPVSNRVEVGDIVAYYREEALTIHRVVGAKRINNDLLLRTKGDNCLTFDPFLIGKSEILGRVVGLVRGGRTINLESKRWRFGGRLLAYYSHVIGIVGRIIKFCAKPFLGTKQNRFVSFGGNVLLFVFSILPRTISALFRMKSGKEK